MALPEVVTSFLSNAAEAVDATRSTLTTSPSSCATRATRPIDQEHLLRLLRDAGNGHHHEDLHYERRPASAWSEEWRLQQIQRLFQQWQKSLQELHVKRQILALDSSLRVRRVCDQIGWLDASLKARSASRAPHHPGHRNDVGQVLLLPRPAPRTPSTLLCFPPGLTARTARTDDDAELLFGAHECCTSSDEFTSVPVTNDEQIERDLIKDCLLRKLRLGLHDSPPSLGNVEGGIHQRTNMSASEVSLSESESGYLADIGSSHCSEQPSVLSGSLDRERVALLLEVRRLKDTNFVPRYRSTWKPLRCFLCGGLNHLAFLCHAQKFASF